MKQHKLTNPAEMDDNMLTIIYQYVQLRIGNNMPLQNDIMGWLLACCTEYELRGLIK